MLQSSFITGTFYEKAEKNEAEATPPNKSAFPTIWSTTNKKIILMCNF